MRRLMQVGLVVAVGAGCGLFGGGSGGEPGPGFEGSPPGYYNFYCYNAGPAKNWAGRADGSEYTPAYVNACVYVDPGDPSWQMKARAGCSAICKAIAWYGKFVCVDENWSSVEPEGNAADGFPMCDPQGQALPPGAVPPGPTDKQTPVAGMKP